MTTLLTDNQLLELIAQKRETGLAQLHARYYETLCKTAYKKLGDEGIVEELIQDVFINIWEKAIGLDPEGNVKAYLYATLRNKILHELRARMVVANYTASAFLKEHQQLPNASDMLQAKELEQKVHSVIRDLSPQCREAFTLSRFEQLSYKSIAERMDISVNTVEKHIGKALTILRRELHEFDVMLTLFLFFYNLLFK